MADRRIDPSRLQGEALRRWYLRSPDEVEQGRQASHAQRYQTFFGNSPSASNEEDGSTATPTRQTAAPAEDILWIADGRGGYRAVRPRSDDFQTTLQPPQDTAFPDYLPRNSAAEEGGDFTAVGNPNNRRLKKAYVREYGPWPVTEDGRSYHVHHIEPTSRGGAQTLENIEPKHPDEHVVHHSKNGDYKAWGAMSGGGRKPAVAPRQPAPAKPPGPTPSRSAGTPAKPSIDATPVPRIARTSARAPRLAGKLGVLGILSDALGITSGRIRARTDTWDNYQADLLGQPSMQDQHKAAEDLQRLINPNWKSGDPWVA